MIVTITVKLERYIEIDYYKKIPVFIKTMIKKFEKDNINNKEYKKFINSISEYINIELLKEYNDYRSFSTKLVIFKK